MLVKKLKFVGYDGQEREEEFMFNLNKAEIIKFMTQNGDYTLDKLILRLTKERQAKRVMEIFEDLMKLSYGKVSVDGRKFEKSDELWEDFVRTEAYSDIFSSIVSDGKEAAAFVNGIIPASMADSIAKAILENKEGIPDELKEYYDILNHKGEVVSSFPDKKGDINVNGSDSRATSSFV